MEMMQTASSQEEPPGAPEGSCEVSPPHLFSALRSNRGSIPACHSLGGREPMPVVHKTRKLPQTNPRRANANEPFDSPALPIHLRNSYHASAVPGIPGNVSVPQIPSK